MREPPIPTSLDWMRDDPEAGPWLERLPGLLDAALARWPGVVGNPYGGGVTSWVAPLTLDDGTEAVIKIPHVDRENRHEADALTAWGGVGAVRLLDQDAATAAMLLERAQPGHPLSRIDPESALDVVVELLPRLTIAAPDQLVDIADEAARWVVALDRNLQKDEPVVDESLAAATREFLDELVESPRLDRVLVHQDLHGDNIVAAQREPWLAIDPKPLAATPAFAVVPLVRSTEFGHTRTATLRRLHRLAEAMGVDRQQAARHTVAQTVAWSFGPPDPMPEHLVTASWLLAETG